MAWCLPETHAFDLTFCQTVAALDGDYPLMPTPTKLNTNATAALSLYYLVAAVPRLAGPIQFSYESAASTMISKDL